MKAPALATALALATSVLATPVPAHDYSVGDITVAHPYAFATAGAAPVGGGYMQIANSGTVDDVLVAVTVAPEVAGMVQLHQMTMADGVMSMSQLAGGIPIPAGATVTLESGGLHVMFMRLAQGLPEGARIEATLTFAIAGDMDMEFTVEPRGGAHGGHGN